MILQEFQQESALGRFLKNSLQRCEFLSIIFWHLLVWISVVDTDFLIEKDPLFARITLDDDEYRLYQTLYDKVIEELPKPDLVVCLQAPTTTLFDRLQRRGNSIERGIDLTYIQTLNDAYTQFFHHYEDSPLLIVNTSEIDLAQGNSDYFNLVKYILRGQPGRHYYNPHPIQ